MEGGFISKPSSRLGAAYRFFKAFVSYTHGLRVIPCQALCICKVMLSRSSLAVDAHCKPHGAPAMQVCGPSPFQLTTGHRARRHDVERHEDFELSVVSIVSDLSRAATPGFWTFLGALGRSWGSRVIFSEASGAWLELHVTGMA